MEPPAAASPEPALFHPIPKLDRPDTLWLLPAPVAKWLGGSLLVPFAVWQCVAFATGTDPALWWGDWRLWLLGAAALVVGALGAFVRPGGLDLARWAGVLLDYAVTPKRAVWKPVGRGILWW